MNDFRISRIMQSRTSISLTDDEQTCFNIINNIVDGIENRSDNRRSAIVIMAVGGWVRDKLLGRKSKDIDMVVSLSAFDKLENKLLQFTPVKRLEEIAQGMDVLRFDLETIEFDIRGLETDSIEDDIKTRDFSINSIYYDIRKSFIVDPKGFISDISHKILRGCQDLPSVFHDKNRYARYCRLMHAMDLTPTDELKKFVMDTCYKRWQQQSQKRELRRLAVELKKALTSDKMEKILTEMADVGVLSCFTGDMSKTKGLITYLVRVKKILSSENWSSIKILYEVRRLQDSESDMGGTFYMLKMAVLFYFYRVKKNHKQSDPFIHSVSCFFDDDKSGKLEQEILCLYNITEIKNIKDQRCAFDMYCRDTANKKPYLAVLSAAYIKDKPDCAALMNSILTGFLEREKSKESSGSSYIDSRIKYLNEDQGFPF